MIIKKFTAATETEAMVLAREELGKEAVVMNIKKVKPKGILRLFKKSSVEITAAVDDTVSDSAKEALAKQQALLKKNQEDLSKNVISALESDKTVLGASAIEKKLDDLQNMIEKQMVKDQDAKSSVNANPLENEKGFGDNDSTWQCISLVKKHMAGNEVEEKFIDQIIEEVKDTLGKDASVDSVLTSIYQKIILKLGQPQLIEVGEDKPKFVFFMGPTGVGKTTSIAKLASALKLNQKNNVALVTSDTYRIAAVDQLRTYANILGVPVSVVYSADDLKNIKDKLKTYDIVLVDTAGRSHKNKDQRDDLKELIDAIEKEDRVLYLVLSATTKYSDLVHIVNAYAHFDDYRLIFTKLDETSTYGNILNIRMLTDAPLSYTTYGQDVPKDIGRIDGQKIAKQLLGGSV